MTGNPHITSITYDHRNQATRTVLNSGNEQIAGYNADGQRVLKEVQTTGGTSWALYLRDGTQTLGMIADGQLHYLNIFGNDAAGRVLANSGSIDANNAKRYYIKDLIGSTRAVVDDNGTTKENRDYYPFGLLMDERQYVQGAETTEKFSGKEHDDQTGFDYFGARYYMPGIGRFTSTDRFADKYPSLSPYQYAANNPALMVDVNGDSIWVYQGDDKYLYEDGTLYNEDGSEYDGESGGFLGKAVAALDKIREGGKSGEELVTRLQESKSRDTNIRKSNNANNINIVGNNNNVYWNPENKQSGLNENGNLDRPSFIGLAHELGHSYSTLDGTFDQSPWYRGSDGKTKPKNEIIGVHWENKIRAEHNEPLRANYEQFDNPASRTLIPGTRYSPHVQNGFKLYRYQGKVGNSFLDQYYRHMSNL